MTLASGCPYVVLLLALVSAGCQSEDTSAKPPFVSVGYGLGPLTAAPLAATAEKLAIWLSHGLAVPIVSEPPTPIKVGS